MTTRPDITFYLPNFEGGGAERAVVWIANQLAGRKLNIELVVGLAVGPYVAEIAPNVSVVELGTSSRFGSVLALAKYLKACRPFRIMSALDLANLQLVAAAKLSRYRGRLIISQRATIGPVYQQVSSLHRLTYLLAIRLAYPMADCIISNSRAAAQELERDFGIKTDRIITIQNQIDRERIVRLASEPLQDAWWDTATQKTIVAVGSLTPRKDMATLIKAFASVRRSRDAKLVILGEGEERQNLAGLAQSLEVSEAVYMPGFDRNPYRWMRRADLLVSTSTAEGFPNVVADALALGLGIVATDCPGDTADLLGHGRWGRLVPVGDADALASAILETLDNPAPAETSLRVADFAPDKVVEAHLSAIMGQSGSAV